MINIITITNSLKTGEKEYCFRSTVSDTMSIDELVKEIVRYNSTITIADVKAVLEVLDDCVKHYVSKGYKVELPFGYVFLKANGTVEKEDDAFLPGTGNHKIKAAFRFKSDANSDMIKSAKYAQVGKGFVSIPKVKSVWNVSDTGEEEKTLSVKRGSLVRIKGELLSFDATDEKQGVFLSSTTSETRLSRYFHIGSNIVDVFIPDDIAENKYDVKVIIKPSENRYEKGLFSGTLEVKS